MAERVGRGSFELGLPPADMEWDEECPDGVGRLEHALSLGDFVDRALGTIPAPRVAPSVWAGNEAYRMLTWLPACRAESGGPVLVLSGGREIRIVRLPRIRRRRFVVVSGDQRVECEILPPREQR